MKKTLLSIAAFLVMALGLVAGLAGCNSTSPSPNAQAFQEQVAKACTVVQPALQTMQAMSAPDPAQAAVLAEVVKVNGALCAGASEIDLASVKTAVSTTIPEAVKVVALLPLDPTKKAEVQIALAGFQVALSAALAQQQ